MWRDRMDHLEVVCLFYPEETSLTFVWYMDVL